MLYAQLLSTRQSPCPSVAVCACVQSDESQLSRVVSVVVVVVEDRRIS